MTPTIKRRFRILPTPKYRRIKNIVAARDRVSPRLVLASRNERVKRREKNTKIKKPGIAPKAKGSTKYMRPARRLQSKIIIRRVGRKFFLSFTSFWRASLRIIS